MALLAIAGYQRYLSPHKGFCCAHRALWGGPSCSEFARLQLRSEPFGVAMGRLRARLGACRVAALALRRKREATPGKREGRSYLDFCDPGCLFVPNDCGLGGIAESAAGGCDAGACIPW